MKIFENFVFFQNNSAVGLSSFKENDNSKIDIPQIYMGDYASMFKINLDKKINPTVGQNLYFLS